MKIIATLSPSVRLVVFQFLMKSNLVPGVVQPKRAFATRPLPPVSGVKVLESTPRLNIFPLAMKIDASDNYELVDVWKKPHETNWNMSFVRFVFCHKKHVNRKKLYPYFVAKRVGLEVALVDLVRNNLWATQGHLNPYFETDGSQSNDKVLMLGCAGRVPNTEVFRDGRDENGRGIGPKVLLSTLSSNLNLIGNEVILVAPKPKQILEIVSITT